MEIHKQPSKTKELCLFELLQCRKSLTTDEFQRFHTLQKGFSGEQKFYQMLEAESVSNSFLFDLLLTSNGTTFQLDSIYLTNDSVTILEVKNYAGDFYIMKGRWYIAKSKQEIRNPIDQLKRSEFLLKQLLQKSHPHLTIHSHLVFIHDEFTLYNAPLELPAILPTQLTQFIKKIRLNRQGSSTNINSISKHLTSLHITNSPFETLPTYTYDELQKGLTCHVDCGGLLVRHTNRTFICMRCKHKQSLSAALYRNILLLAKLFPNKKITIELVSNWCRNSLGRGTIRGVLSKHLKYIPNGKHSYYLLEKKE